MSIAKEIGWAPNRAARALSAARAGACGLALARPAGTLAYEPFFSKLLSGIEAELSARQLALVLQIVEDVNAETGALRRWWAEHRVDGVMMVDLRVDDPRVPAIEEVGLPAVIIGGPGDTGKLHYLPGNDADGITQIVRHLVGLGHRRIDRVGGSPAFASTQVRGTTFRRELGRAGARGRTLGTDFSSAAGARAARRLLASSPRPTAIVFDNDLMAVAGLGVAQELGISVPEDLSVVSFDDSLLCEVVRPALTACARDIAEYGSRAALALVDLIESADVSAAGPEPSRLVLRASTGPAPH